MATLVYLLCAVTSALCAVLLYREFRRVGSRLLLWSWLSFVGWTATNILVFADVVVLPDVDLSVVRALAACVAVALMLVGLIWNAD